MNYDKLSYDELQSIAREVGYAFARRKVMTPCDVHRRLRYLAAEPQEHYVVITLDGAHKMIDIHTITIGLVNRTMTHPREVYRRAIADNAAAIITAHNHPSGEGTWSTDDEQVRERMRAAGEIVGIRLVDDLLVHATGIVSAVESGDL